jgi:hypothetical protein
VGVQGCEIVSYHLEDRMPEKDSELRSTFNMGGISINAENKLIVEANSDIQNGISKTFFVRGVTKYGISVYKEVSVTYNDPCSGVKFDYRGQYNAVSNFKTIAVPSMAYTGSKKNFELYNIGEKGWNLVSEFNPRSSKAIDCPVSGFSIK